MAGLLSVHAPVANLAGVQSAPQQLRTAIPFRSSRLRSTASRIVAMAGGPFEKIADKLGDEVYADLNGWRLYLRDMKADGGKTMAQELAERVASGDSVEAALSGISVKLGGGKTTVTLADVVPDAQMKNAVRALEDLDD